MAKIKLNELPPEQLVPIPFSTIKSIKQQVCDDGVSVIVDALLTYEVDIERQQVMIPVLVLIRYFNLLEDNFGNHNHLDDLFTLEYKTSKLERLQWYSFYDEDSCSFALVLAVGKVSGKYELVIKDTDYIRDFLGDLGRKHQGTAISERSFIASTQGKCEMVLVEDLYRIRGFRTVDHPNFFPNEERTDLEKGVKLLDQLRTKEITLQDIVK